MRKTSKERARNKTTVADVARAIESFAPRALAEGFDRVGLAIGSAGAKVAHVMLSLEADEKAVREADRRGAQMIVAHHPPTLSEAASIDLDSSFGKTLAAAVRKDVHVYCAHTNFDSAQGGTNEVLCDLLGISDVVPIVRRSVDDRLKLVVFVPQENLEAVSRAVCDAGAGVIGEYDHCTWRSVGTGTFRGSEKSKPTVGRAGAIEEVSEFRLECVVGRGRLHGVVAALRAAHCYEEPAFDVYELAAADAKTGPGRIGDLAKPTTPGAFVTELKRLLRVKHVRMTPGAKRRIRRAAVCAGSGGSLVLGAVASGADAFVTGEVKYHDALAAREAGMCIMECGHYNTEQIALAPLAKRLGGMLPGVKMSVFKGSGEPQRVV